MLVAERRRNARGEGSRLRDELLAGAQRLLERTGSEDAVTLRAVAREAGVSAPSIYAHFADGRALVDALVSAAFQELSARLRQAAAATREPGERLRAVSAEYVRFGLEHPERYQTLFERRRSVERAAQLRAEGRPFEGTSGAEAFEILAGAVEAAAGTTRAQAEESAALLWAALHGYVALRGSSPGFPWFADEDRIVDDLLRRFAG